MIEFLNVTKKYRDDLALENVSFDIKQGEVVAVIGSNGAGKTTLFKLISGIIKPTSGEVKVFNQDPFKSHLYPVSIVGEELGLKESFTVQTYLTILSSIANNSQYREEVFSCFQIDALLNKRIRELSRGQKKRVALARAFMSEHKLILLDEPFSGLDPRQVINLRKLVVTKLKSGVTILINSHDLAELGNVAQRVILLINGLVNYQGYIADIQQRNIWHMHLKGDMNRNKSILDNTKGILEYSFVDNHLTVEAETQQIINGLLVDLEPLQYSPVPLMEQLYVDRLGES